jgi:hypothetical protein
VEGWYVWIHTNFSGAGNRNGDIYVHPFSHALDEAESAGLSEHGDALLPEVREQPQRGG